jgi:hypothetical protein
MDDILTLNKGQQAYVVTTLLLVVEALFSNGATAVAEKFSHTPLSCWDECQFAKIETIARAATHLETNLPTKTPNLKHAFVARCKTLLGRDLRHHDETAELAQRSWASVPHSWNLNSDRGDSWHSHLYAQLLQFAQAAILQAPSALQPASTWWAARAAWLGSGSSSAKDKLHLLPKAIVENSRLRLTKNIIIANSDASFFEMAMLSKPVMACRSATKNEPGLKRRALRAADDKSYLIAAFASNNMEKYLSINGVVMRQTPSDVREAAEGVYNTAHRLNSLMLCIDYSDFNTTHTTRARALLNVAMAATYLKFGHPEQAAAAAWMAAAQLNHTISGIVSNQGLSSGERDTARDNTMLHSVYQQSITVACQIIHICWRKPAMVRMCGDDEICIGISWADAQRYIDQHMVQGHIIQPRKIMLSASCGEFLQYNMKQKKELPTQPLIPNLVNFVSGSWYKSSNYNVTQYPNQISDAAASCIRRGARRHTMMMMCMASCNWLCAGQPWREALLATNLFGRKVPPPTTADNPNRVSVQQMLDGHATPGVHEYSRLLMSRYRLRPAVMTWLRELIENQIYEGVNAEINKVKEVYEPVAQPISTIELDGEPSTIDETKVIPRWLTSQAVSRFDQHVWMAVQLGVPPQLIKRIGTEQLLRAANNTIRAHFIAMPPSSLNSKVIPEHYAMLPGAIAPYFSI